MDSLLEKGADPNLADTLGRTALHFSAQEGAIEASAVLLDAGAEVDPQDSFGNSPLFVAVFNSRGRGDLIQLLREHGADPMRTNRAGQTPAGLARLIDNYNVVQYFADIG